MNQGAKAPQVKIQNQNKMFGDSAGESVSIPSSWKKEKHLKSGTCQTEECNNFDQESQVAFYQDQSCQTEAKKLPDSAKNPLQDPKFYKFIAKAVPMLEAELDAASRSRAFDGYFLLDSELESQVRKLHTLDATLTRTQNQGLKVSCITWSCVGSTVGVAFEAEEHDDWCDHPSSLHIWNLNRRDFDPGTAYKVLNSPACLTVAKFHPVEPGLIIAGGHSGEIYAWNAFSDSDQLLASSGVGSIHGHKDKISSINWINASHLDSRNAYNLYWILSCGLDGIILLWSLDAGKNNLNPVRKMLVEPKYLQKSGIKSRKTDVGITCLSANILDNSTVIFGTESGAIFEGSLTVHNIIHAQDQDEHEWHDPVKVTFFGHNGRVNAISFSPFERNIFLSSGSDQEIRIYSLLHPYAPIHAIPLEDTSAASLDWSLARPLVFAAGLLNHKLMIFDLRSAKNIAKAAALALELKASEKLIPFPLTSVAFGAKTNGLIATGDGFGRVHIWKLTSGYMSRNPDENSILESLGIKSE